MVRSSKEIVDSISPLGSHFETRFVVLQQVWFYKHAQLSSVTKGSHATFGFGNASNSETRHYWNEEPTRKLLARVERVLPAIEDAMMLEVRQFSDVTTSYFKHERAPLFEEGTRGKYLNVHLDHVI